MTDIHLTPANITSALAIAGVPPRHAEGELECSYSVLGAGHCVGTARVLEFRPGFSLRVEDIRPAETVMFHLYEDCEQLAVTVCIQGLIQGSLQGGARLPPVEGRRNMALCFTPGAISRMQITGDCPTRCVSVCMDLPLVNESFPDIDGLLPLAMEQALGRQSQPHFCHVGSACRPVLEAGHQILACPYAGSLRRMYLECKSMELLTHQLADMAKSGGHMQEEKFRLSAFDVERLHDAKTIIDRQFDDPPSIAQLARLVGLNKNKLTRGFRHLFQASIFDYCISCRLDHAKSLMETRGYNITEAALSVGYAHPCSFTRAFKRRFGFPPKNC